MRVLTPLLDSLMLSATRREPAWIVEIYDIRSTASDPTPTTIGDVVKSRVADPPPTLPTIVGPRDFTDDVLTFTIDEVAGDYVDSGVATSSLRMTIIDPSAELDPLENPPTTVAPEALGRWLRQGNVVVVREGDDQVPTSEWPAVFTGLLSGQPGRDRNRTTGNAELTVQALGRESQFLNQTITTVVFPQSTPYSDIIEAVAETEMGLTDDEQALPTSFGTTLTCLRSTQLVEENPLAGIAKVLLGDGQLPRFDGDGRLTLIDGDTSKSAARIYADDELIRSVVRPVVVESGTNSVVVLGIDCDLSEVVQGRQTLARASITTGFFSAGANIPVQWSEDGTLQARNTRLEVLSSVGAGIFNFGSESYSEATLPDGNSLTGEIEVDGGLALGLAVVAFILGTWQLLENTPEPVTLVVVERPNFRSIAKGALQQALGIALGSVGRGQYEITGEVVEYVLRELRGQAKVAGLGTGELREVTIENGLINTQADLDATALRILRRERAKQNVRSIEMVPDLRLEPDDVFQTSDGRRYMIRSISRTAVRDGDYLATIDGFEVTSGVRP